MTTPTQAQVEAALKKYGDHTYECSSNETIDPTNKPPCDCGWDEWKGLTAAAQVGTFEAGPDECDTGVALTKAIDAVLAEDTPLVNHTIERCAQVAEKFENGPLRFEIAAAIRKLKDDAA